MRSMVVIYAIGLLILAAPAFAQLTDAQVETAIADKKAQKFQTVGAGAGPFRIVIAGPMTRVNSVLDISKAIQPTSREAFPQEWGNALGAKFSGQGMTADFDITSLPPGEFDVVVGCECARQARGTIKIKDRAKIQ